jgi:HlyD family secretion protein
MNKTLKYSLIGVAILLIVIGIGKKAGFIGKDTGVNVTVEKAAKRNITEIVSASGKIQPEVEVKISPDVSGEIVELYVKEGQQVKKGQLLCKINPDLYITSRDRMEASVNTSRANLSNASARLMQAKASFANTETSYNRNKKLFEQGAISQADIDIASAQYNAAKADLEALQQTIKASEYNVANALASLKEANENLGRTTILSPVSGRISKLNIELGERVVGTSQMAGTELLRIADLDEMEVLVDVNENDIVRVHLNDSVNIEVDAYLGKKFTGLVTEIANSATNINSTSGTDQVTNFQVKVRISRESYTQLISTSNPSPFRPGMTATVDIKTKTEKNILTIPIQCVTQRNDTTSIKGKNEKENTSEFENKTPIQLVFVNSNNKAVVKAVKTGIQDNTYIQITEGLNVGDAVITAPYKAITKRLKNGDKIKVVSKNDLPKELEKEDE